MEQILDEVSINGVKYYRNNNSNNITSPIKIVVLQRGWVVIGRFERDGNDCKLYNAHIIRSWGTEKGIGELANGKTSKTILDKCYGVVEFDYLTTILLINCEEKAWKEIL
jgi:hypothetical protein